MNEISPMSVDVAKGNDRTVITTVRVRSNGENEILSCEEVEEEHNHE